MGTLTYTEITTEITAALGNRTQFDADRLLNIINLTQMRMARKKRWKELQTTEDSTFTITASAETDKKISVPTNVRDILTFRTVTDDGQSRKLQRRTVRQLDRLIPEPEWFSRGTPEIYVEFEGSLELWRVPDAADRYLIRFTTWPTVFTGTGAPTQTSDFTNKDDMIIALSVSWAFTSIGRMEDAARWWAMYKDMLTIAETEDRDNPDEIIVADRDDAGVRTDYWRDPFFRGIGGYDR